MIGDSIARSGDRWIDFCELTISPLDIGVRQGVIAVERLRTYGGAVFELSRHLDRWQRTIEGLRLSGLPSRDDVSRLCLELLDRNEAILRAQTDVGITWLATPGTRKASPSTFVMHIQPLSHDAIGQRIACGQALIITRVMQPPGESWSRQFKVRCRLHYYLADLAAAEHDEDASGVLVDLDGSVTETSISNLAIVRKSRIVSPPRKQVLGGVTQSVAEDLAAESGIDWEHATITPDELRNAEEVLLMGTDTGVWFANRVDDAMIRDGRGGPVYRQLRQRFDRAVKRVD